MTTDPGQGSMRERIAERMWQVSGLDRKVWDDPLINEMLHNYADAALDELREPTEAMIREGSVTNSICNRDIAEKAWRRMIAEASK